VLRKWVLTALSPPLRAGNWVLGEITGSVNGYIALRGAHEENIHLREEVDRLTRERDEAREEAAEDARLRTQLGIVALPQFRQVAATVISRDPSIWFKRLIINRGSMDGIKPNMPVIAASGVVGRVTEVGPDCAMIQVITDRHAGVGAILQQSGSMGEVRGLDSADCEMKDVGSNVDVQPNEPIVTTGLDGIYPKGITIGTVESVQNDPNAPWLKIVVRPTAPVDRLENVIVLLVEPKDLKMQETVK
jgi:rod shape-determining protein MreC